MSNIIEVQHLSKTFGTHRAVNDLSFTIQAGDVYGFLGQNGAGKSTTIRMLLGLIHPDIGSIKIHGQSFTNSNRHRHLLNHIGAIIERPDMYGYLSGWDNLRIFARLSGNRIPDSRLHQVLDIVGLTGREKDKVRAYSQGMKQRLGIAIAMVHSPDLLILDEPTNGLDPQGIAEMRQLIQHLSRDHGKTILISSHLLYEVEQIATRMLIIHKGAKMAEGLVTDLLRPEETLVEVHMQQHESVEAALQATRWQQYIQAAGRTQLLFKMSPEHIPALNEWLVGQGVRVTELKSRHSLEAYFLSLTNEVAHVKA